MRVNSVATTSPPITAYAIGPQNTVGAIGIMPRIAAVGLFAPLPDFWSDYDFGLQLLHAAQIGPFR